MSAAPRIEVASGGSARVSRTLRSPCTVHVGSSSSCDLRVVGRGVRAQHLALEWDGERLVIVRGVGSGPVRVEGLPVRPPFVIVGSVRVQIGDAEVWAVAPLAPEDEPTLVMAARSDEPTEVPPPCPEGSPSDVTTTERLRPPRSRLALTSPRRSAVLIVAAIVAALLAFGVCRPARVVQPGGSSAAVSAVSAAPLRVARSYRAPASAPAPGAAAPSASGVAPATAALLLAAGHRAEAVDAYATLARLRPEEPVFGVVARILAREVHGSSAPSRVPPETAR